MGSVPEAGSGESVKLLRVVRFPGRGFDYAGWVVSDRLDTQTGVGLPLDPGDAERFERVRAVFAVVVEVPAAERGERLEALAGSDPPLRAAVEALLAHADAADREGFLNDPVGEPRGGGPAGGSGESAMPERLGPYRVVGRLGEGGSGLVYRAESPAPLRRAVAVKLLRAGVSAAAAARAEVEAGVLASFNHPGIAQVYETGVLEDGRRWIACELVEGEPLNRAGGSMDWRARVDLVAQAAEAVHHAHQRGVVHRDMKPSNILVVDGTNRVKVIDFGIARSMGDARAVTEPGLLVGTLAYMSPEQLAGGEVDARTDVYGLGVALFEALVGRLPPGRDGGLAGLTRAAETAVRGRLPPMGGRERDLRGVIARATDPSPEKRYPSMQHMADDLRRVLANQPVLARRPGPAWALRLYARRHPATSVVVVLALVTIVVLVGALASSRGQLAAEVDDQRLLISSLVSDTLEGLARVRGTVEQREAMVGLLLERHTRILGERPDDPALRWVQARLLRERGDLASGLGRFEEAMGDLVASRALYDALAAEGYGGADLGRLHAESLIRLGDVGVEMRQGEGVADARGLYRQAMAMQEELVRRHPGRVGLLDDLCWSYDRIGSLGDLWGVESDEALEAWKLTRVELSEELLGVDPDRSLSRYNLATGHLRLARFFGTRGRHEESARHVELGMPHIEAAVRSEPERTMYVQVLVGMCSWEVQTCLRLGRFDEIPELIDRHLRVARAQVRAMPGDLGSMKILLSAIFQAARTYSEIGHTETARALASECLEWAEVFRSGAPGSRLDDVELIETQAREILERPGG